MLKRRDLVKLMGSSLLASTLPGVSFARVQTDSRFVLLILRGAVDGLALLAPYGEPAYTGLRGELALSAPGTSGGVLKIDGLFGLHPSLPSLHAMYGKRQALLLHAVATPYRERSHFDAQDVLESGALQPGHIRSGWLNRALGGLPQPPKEAAIAMTQNLPMVLRGAEAVTSWAPSRLPGTDEETLQRIRNLYANDPFFSSRLQQALDSQEIAGDIQTTTRRSNRDAQAREMMQATARFLRAPEGPRIAVIESGGWDTHANQGGASGSLANKFSELDTGLKAFHLAMGNDWSKTVMAVVTEFGRTARVNGTRGTDHGTASAAFLVGGAVNGGRILTDWPGLAGASLYQGRDLAPSTDLRAMLKGVLADHLGVARHHLDTEVFPDSACTPGLRDLVTG